MGIFKWLNYQSKIYFFTWIFFCTFAFRILLDNIDLQFHCEKQNKHKHLSLSLSFLFIFYSVDHKSIWHKWKKLLQGQYLLHWKKLYKPRMKTNPQIIVNHIVYSFSFLPLHGLKADEELICLKACCFLPTISVNLIKDNDCTNFLLTHISQSR